MLPELYINLQGLLDYLYTFQLHGWRFTPKQEIVFCVAPVGISKQARLLYCADIETIQLPGFQAPLYIQLLAVFTFSPLHRHQSSPSTTTSTTPLPLRTPTRLAGGYNKEMEETNVYLIEIERQRWPVVKFSKSLLKPEDMATRTGNYKIAVLPIERNELLVFILDPSCDHSTNTV